MKRWPRSVLWLALRTNLRAAALPTLLAAVCAALLAPAAADQGAGARVAAAPWLELPLLVALAWHVWTTLRLWPLFARAQPGQAWLARLQRGPWQGLGAVAFGAAASCWLLTAPLLLALAAWLGAPRAVPLPIDCHFVAAHPPLLLTPGERVSVVLDPPSELRELRLRPRAGPPLGEFMPSTLGIWADGQELGRVAFEQDRQAALVVPPAQPVAQLQFAHLQGSVPLWFDANSLTLLGKEQGSLGANVAVWAALGAIALWAALLCAACVGMVATLPTTAFVAGAGLFLATLGGIGVLAQAPAALLRGQWLAADASGAFVPFLGGGVAAMMLRMLIQRRPSR